MTQQQPRFATAAQLAALQGALAAEVRWRKMMGTRATDQAIATDVARWAGVPNLDRSLRMLRRRMTMRERKAAAAHCAVGPGSFT
jgi:hypothetical protein